MDHMNKIILLVEDDENDVFFMRRALQKANLELPLKVVMDGQSAIDYLEGNGDYADRTQNPLPGLILLDLKLPYLHGFEVLAWIRQHPTFEELPVVILTSSPEERDRRQAAALNAQAYCVKPPTREMMLEVLSPLVEAFTPLSSSMQ
jgi:CheY-like chemotaxis protein